MHSYFCLCMRLCVCVRVCVCIYTLTLSHKLTHRDALAQTIHHFGIPLTRQSVKTNVFREGNLNV